MKSKLFTNHFDLKDEKNEAFTKDLCQLLALSEAQRASVLAVIPPLSRSTTGAEDKRILDALSAETGLTLLELNDVVGVSKFLASRMLDDETKDDTPEQWASDLVEADILNEQESEACRAVLELLRAEHVEELRAIRKGRAYSVGVFPSLRKAGTTVELRGVFEEPYDWGKPLDEYTPQLNDVVPVVSIHLAMNGGSPDEIWFQASPEELDLLINKLQGAKKAVDVLKSRAALSAD